MAISYLRRAARRALAASMVALVSACGADAPPRSTAPTAPPTSRVMSGPAPALAGVLSFARALHAATLLLDGRVLVSGGASSLANDRVPLDSIELFDPASARFRATSPSGVEWRMQQARDRHTSTLLADGTVLLAGGRDGAGNAMASAERFDPRTGATTLTGPMNVGRYAHTATRLRDGSVLVLGGGTGAATDDLRTTTAEVFDPSTSTFTPLSASMATPRRAHTTTTLTDGRLLVWGGTPPGEFWRPEIYDPAAGTFGTATTSSISSIGSTATLLADGRVLLLAGLWSFEPGTPTSTGSALLFDPSTGDVTPAPITAGGDTALRLPDGRVLSIGGGGGGARLVDVGSGRQDDLPAVQRRLATATLLPDGRALIVGGYDGAASALALATVEVFDGAAASLQPHSSKPLAVRESPTVVGLPSGAIVVAGGTGERSIELRAKGASTFSLFPDALPKGRRAAKSALLAGDDVWLVGGTDDGFAITATTERFAPSTGVVTTSVTLATPRLDHTVTPLPDGRVLVAGGAEQPGCKCSSAEIADPDGVGAPSGLLSMTTFRQGHTATWIPSTGTVLIAGGDLLKKTAEVFDPKTGAFTPAAGPMAAMRYLHSATPLADGRVLLVGGGVKSAELFDPATTTFSATSNKPLAARHTHAAALLKDGRVLIAGGAEVHEAGSGLPNTPLTSAEIFDPSTDEFTPTKGSLRFAGFTSHAIVRSDGRVAIVGQGDSPIEIFDPVSGEFVDDVVAETVPCATATAATRAWSCVVTETGTGRALLTGGLSTRAAWLSPSGALSTGPKLTVARARHTSTVLTSGVALIGGEAADGVTPSVELVDVATSISKPVGALVTARAQHTTTRLPDGRLLVLGGETASGDVVGTLELFAIDGGRIAQATSATMPAKRTRHAATLMSDGRVLVVGGIADGRPVLAVEAFDAKLGTWTALGQANVGERPSIAHLPDGSTAFVGGGGAYLFRAGAKEVVPLDAAVGARLTALPSGQILACRDGCRSLSAGVLWSDVAPLTVEPTDGATALGSSSVVFAGQRQGAGWFGWVSTQPKSAVAPVLDAPFESAALRIGDTLKLTGKRFLAGVLPGAIDGVPSVEGVASVVFRPLDGAGPAVPLAITKLRDDAIEATVPNTAHTGLGWLYVLVDGVASEARLVNVSRSAVGRACRVSAECTTGYCADGVCCESACQDGCRACAAALRGATGGDDGQCLPIEKSGAPRFGCEPTDGNVCGPTGTCDGDGACAFPPRSTPCDTVPGGTCNSGVCAAPLTCASHADCAVGQRCTTAGRCESASALPDANDPGACAIGQGPGPMHAGAWLFLAAAVALLRRRARWAAVSSVLLATPRAFADGAPPPPPPASALAPAAPDPRREEARDLLRKGLSLHAAGDLDKALDYFLRSKAVFPAKGNTLNAASSLRSLGRLDEALDQYEDALASFGATFDDDDKVAVPRAMAELRAQLGVVRVSGDVNGVVVVGGRARGTLPLASGVRLMPGGHTLRVIKDGYKTFERRVTVRAGETVNVDAKLEPLAESGGLRIEAPGLVEADVFVDGVRVGTAPWEGTLAPGPHVVSARRGDLGSAPFLATVLQGQTALVRARSGRLSGRHRVVVRPESAELSFDGVPLGKSAWSSELPPGRYEIAASEPGYFPKKAELIVTEIDEGGALELSLVVDRAHPRWPKAPVGRVRAELFAMIGFGTTMHSGANDSCDAAACDARGLVTGPVGGLVAAFEFPFRLSVEAGAGGLSLSQSQSREVARAGAPDVTYRLDDLQRLKGWWLGVGLGHRAPLGASWSLRSRLMAGVIFARTSDTITGVVRSGGAEDRAAVDGSGETVASTPLFAAPQIGVSRTFGEWDVGGALAAWVVLSRGPSLGHGALRVSPSCDPSTPSAPGCVADSSQLAGERSYGAFVVVAPQLSLSRSF